MIGNNEGIYILFRQQDFWFAFPSEMLVEIVRYPKNYRMQNNRLEIRNEEIDVYFFNQFLVAQEEKVSLSQSNILVLNGNQGKIGLVIDQAEEVNKIPKTAIYPIIPLVLKQNQEMFLGVTFLKNKMVTILDHYVLYDKCFQDRSGNKKEVLNGAQDITGGR